MFNINGNDVYNISVYINNLNLKKHITTINNIRFSDAIKQATKFSDNGIIKSLSVDNNGNVDIRMKSGFVDISVNMIKH